jgi:hypothetical protein
MLQFPQSLSDRLTNQDNPHTPFLAIQFHYCNYLRFCPLFTLAAKHGCSRLHFEEDSNNTKRVLTNLLNIDQPEAPDSGANTEKRSPPRAGWFQIMESPD